MGEVETSSSRIAFLRMSLDRVRRARAMMMSRLPHRTLEELNTIRERSIREIETNKETLRNAVESAGGHFILAENAAQATEYVLDIVRRSGGRLVVKSKSMTSEEIDLNHILERAGFHVVETDLGERIVQTAGERPTHILAPALHLTSAEVSRILTGETGHTPSDIVDYMRREMKRYFFTADVGITGANSISAEDGSILIVTNEGNDRFVTTIPRTYVCVAGVEKVVSNLEEALRMVEVQVASATGQRLTSYLTIISPKSEDFGRGRQFHLVLVDNGRLVAAKEPELAETLKCIRCAACFNVCPTYRVVGGHVFGHRYTGPIGIPWTYITAGSAASASFSGMCISCGLCQIECPVKIDIPHLISFVKEREVMSGHRKPSPLARHYERLIRIGARMPRVANSILQDGPSRLLLERFFGLNRRRSLPKFPSKSLPRLFATLDRPGNPVARVALFTDSLIMYVFPELGIEAARTLKNLDIESLLPEQWGSGMPLIQNGYLSDARKVAEKNVKSLARYVNSGLEIICLEPTSEYCLKEVYPKLLNSQEAYLVKSKTRSFYEYLTGPVEKLDTHGQKGRILYHMPCHSRPLYNEAPTITILKRLGYEVSQIEAGCCGMAGVWGVVNFHLSELVAGELLEAVEKSGNGTIVSDSTICMIQLQQFYGGETRHAISLIYENIRELNV
ncbi:MAG: LUD domain-containing protein [Nitrososphaerota archaeon]